MREGDMFLILGGCSPFEPRQTHTHTRSPRIECARQWLLMLLDLSPRTPSPFPLRRSARPVNNPCGGTQCNSEWSVERGASRTYVRPASYSEPYNRSQEQTGEFAQNIPAREPRIFCAIECFRAQFNALERRRRRHFSMARMKAIPAPA